MTVDLPTDSSYSISPLSDLASVIRERSPAFQGALLAFNSNDSASSSTPRSLHRQDAAAVSANGLKNSHNFRKDRASIAAPPSRRGNVSQIAASRASSQAYARPNGSDKEMSPPKPPSQASTSSQSTSGQTPVTEAGVEEIGSPGARSLIQLFETKQTTHLLPKSTQSVRYVNDNSRSSLGKSIETRPKSMKTYTQKSTGPKTTREATQGIDYILPTHTERPMSPSKDNSACPTKPVSSFEDNDTIPPVVGPLDSDVLEHKESRQSCNCAEAPGCDNSSHSTRWSAQQDFRPNSGALAKPTGQGIHLLPARSPDSPPFSSLANRSLPLQHQTKPRPPNMKAKPGNVPTRNPYTFSRNMSVDSLANAIVASSLASSRAPSPARLSIPPPPPPRRHHLFHRGSSQEITSRASSPAKTMRQTMRKPVSSDEETESQRKEKGKSHLVRKHPNKHHEGDRKRWRTQVAEKERRKYEGVWAANKGLHMTFPDVDAAPDNSGAVLNIVVRDIWRRSRLPDSVLAEIWELVSRKGADNLAREEFVVGMWLIDQRLKGNKLPASISESVWASVTMLEGIKLPSKQD